MTEITSRKGQICKSLDCVGVTLTLEPLKKAGFKVRNKNLNEVVTRLSEVINDSVASENVLRVSRLFKDFLGLTGNAFYVKHLSVVMQLLEFLGWKAREVGEYQVHLDRMLEFCCEPPIFEKTSESLFCQDDLEEYFTVLGCLMAILPRSQNILQVQTAIRRLLVRTRPTAVSAVRAELCQRAMEKSRLPVTVVELLEVYEGEMFEKLLDLIKVIVAVSEHCCHKLLQSKILDHLLVRLNPYYDKENYCIPPPEVPQQEAERPEYQGVLFLVTKVTLALMMSVFPSGKKFPACLEDFCSPTRCAMWGLRYAFKREVLYARRKTKTHSVRNDLATVILTGLVGLPSWKIIECGLAEDVSVLVAAYEFGAKDSWAETAPAVTTNEDLSFRKTLLLIICHLVKCDTSINIMEERSVLLALLDFINPSRVRTFRVSCRNPREFLELFQCSIRTLTLLIPKMTKSFRAHNGARRYTSARLLTIIKWWMTVDDETYVITDCLITIASIVSAVECVKIQNDFIEEDAIPILINLINFVVIHDKSLVMDRQRVITLAMIILKSLQSNRISSVAETLSDQSVKMVVQLLQRTFGLTRINTKGNLDFQVDQRYLEIPPSGIAMSDKRINIIGRLLIAVGVYVWKCIVYCPINLKNFIETGGTYLILDIIDRVKYPVICVYIGILADMCEGSFSAAELATWRGVDKQKGLMSLLARVWREEEIRIGVQRTANGSIEDAELPLMGTEQQLSTYHARLDQSCSPALLEMIGSTRAKIHAIRRIIERETFGYNRAKEHYKVLYEDLCTTDIITMQIVDHYFNLKQGQIWIEVVKYLEQVGVNPLGMDGQMMFLMIQRHRGRGVFIQGNQEKLLKTARDADAKIEKEEFARIRDSKLTLALTALKEIDYLRRTTDRKYMLERKAVQRKEVNAALKFPFVADENHCHRTFFEKSNVTAILGQNQRIDSVKMIETDLGRGKLLPVSLSNSKVSSPRLSFGSIRCDSEDILSCNKCLRSDVLCSHR